MPFPKRIPEPAGWTAYEEGQQAELGRDAYDVAEQLRALIVEMGDLNWRVEGYSLEQLTDVARSLRSASVGIVAASQETAR
jgi:hypothetical protein